ncbi:MAG TPA: hypothetical protein VNN80_00970 [Polyangiaceae bacterium]|jgi:hypothetical protein|nr:hypothetical protein [Polyangiaceae bacterium]
MTSELERAGSARVFFSHHSVGRNLLDGVASVSAAQAGGKLEVLPLERAGAHAGPAWFHASGGQNQHPESKVDYFVETLTQQADLKPQLAFMKFCYVDFNPETNVDALFGYYERAIRKLQQEHPETKFAHVTVPLTRHPTELKWRVYRLLGRPVWEDAANVKRQQFNQKLLATFARDPIFDLARAESTRIDGSREEFEASGQTYYALDQRYAADEGHLNERGQRELGGELIKFVARAL